MSTHRRLSPSQAERWINCTGSPALIDRLPVMERDRPTIYAWRGTLLHEVAAQALLGKPVPDPWTKLSNDPEYILTEDDLEGLQVYLDVVQPLQGNCLWCGVEVPLELDEIDPELGGMADFVALADGTLHVVDLKNGSGVTVSPERNPQLLQYALGSLNRVAAIWPGAWKKHVQQVEITVVQPWAAIGEAVKVWRLDPSQLIEHAGVLLEAVEKVHRNPTLRIGEWCRWCPAIGICPAQHAELETVREQLIEPVDLSVAEIGRVLWTWEVLEPRIKEIYSRALVMAEQGVEIPLMKLVPKRAMRKWVDDAGAEAVLEHLGKTDDEIFTKKILSPAQAEKAWGKKFYNEFLSAQAEKKSSGYNLVPVFDEAKGPDLTPRLPSPADLGID